MKNFVLPSKLVLSSPALLLVLAGHAVAAPVTVFQDSVRGGISVDATGVSTPRADARCNAAPFQAGCDFTSPPADPNAWYTAPKPLQLSVPAGSTIKKAFLAIQSSDTRFRNPTPEEQVRFNGKLVREAGAPVHDVEGSLSGGSGVRIFDVTNGFGVTASKTTYSVEERGDADLQARTNAGAIAGVQLVVIYENQSQPWTRHISYFADYTATPIAPATASFALTNLPVCGTSQRRAILSFGVTHECSDEQGKTIIRANTGGGAPVIMSSHAGGRDDARLLSSGERYDASCAQQDWNSLLTVGSFGANAQGEFVGLDGDNFGGEPRADGTATNSRLGDELLSINGSGAASTWTFTAQGDASQRITSLILVSEQDDTDCDGIPDVSDNCPAEANPDQADRDNDGVGDVCDNCPAHANSDQRDMDGDGDGDACDDDIDGDGVKNSEEERLGTDPRNKDSDGDGIPDNVELSADGSGNGPFTYVDTDGDGVIDALDLDSDNDCLPDAQERSTWRDPSKPGNPDDNCPGSQTCNTNTGSCEGAGSSSGASGNNGASSSGASGTSGKPDGGDAYDPNEDPNNLTGGSCAVGSSSDTMAWLALAVGLACVARRRVRKNAR